MGVFGATWRQAVAGRYWDSETRDEAPCRACASSKSGFRTARIGNDAILLYRLSATNPER